MEPAELLLYGLNWALSLLRPGLPTSLGFFQPCFHPVSTPFPQGGHCNLQVGCQPYLKASKLMEISRLACSYFLHPLCSPSGASQSGRMGGVVSSRVSSRSQPQTSPAFGEAIATLTLTPSSHSVLEPVPRKATSILPYMVKILPDLGGCFN